MNSTNHNRTLGLGILIILSGFFILLDQVGLLSPKVSDIFISWQMLLIVIGVYNLFFTDSSKTFGWILIVVGGFFLLPEIFTLPYNFRRNFWPVLLILVGFFILFKSGVFGKKEQAVKPVEADEMEYFDEVNVFSGSEKRISIKNFRGGRITSIFGGSDIDFTGSTLAEGTQVIEVFYLFGGSTLKVPENWVVVNKVTAILGGFSDKRHTAGRSPDEAKNVLVIRGTVMFGGGEIKS